MNYIDLHAHILPGLDDGPETLQESLEAARLAWEKGITRMVATPHVLEGVYNNTTDIITEEVENFTRELEKVNCPLEVYVGAEIFITRDLIESILTGTFPTINGSKYLFIEAPVNQNIPPYLENLLFELQVKGYRPVIPHPERILEVQDDPNVLLPMINGGTLMQVTLTSFSGVFGEKVKKTAEIMLECDMVHLLATDLHGLGARLRFFEQGMERVKELAGSEKLDLLLKYNPERVLQGKDIEIPEPVYYRPLNRWQLFVLALQKLLWGNGRRVA